MLKEEIYMKTSTEFGTPVGVANIIGIKTKEDSIKEVGIKEWRTVEGDLDVNQIIKLAISKGKYQQLFRKVWELEKRVSSRVKDKTIYKTAWKEIK